MGESGLIEILSALARMLAIGAGLLSAVVFCAVLWLNISELRHKKT